MKKGNYLLLGVTGGIATGKSTVTRMLKEMGAAVIDMDVIARQVVEPGKPALQDIVGYFGKEVLQSDGSLDRKKVSKIVFNDPEKRKKLESFTHPRIYEEFFRQVNVIVENNPNAVIQAEVPLLIEMNLQHLFDKIILVYAPREEQIRRLTKRDNISEAEAIQILAAQLPIAEKVKYADFVIENQGDPEHTGKQVKELWERLKKIEN
ncbi:MAG: dephospho-CoA kinase [Desulfobacteraceae bacterium IS3]|nr:MAG: dephospho-CoA kinase [Desulfobacteraceae bacterium IS3]